jgi:predicted porin
MKLKRITLVCIGALGAPAIAAAQTAQVSAPTPSVQIYGTLNADFESVEATGAASGQNFARRNRVTSNSSNIGFRGNEPLGSGLNGFFQIESAVNFDDGTSSGFWASRNSGVGLQGGWGQVTLGQWDSPYKNSTQRFDPFNDTSIAAYTGIMGGTGTITGGQGGSSFAQRASFDRRVSNTVQYWTPSWNGLSARFAYGATDSALGSASTGVAEDSGLKPNLYSAMANYDAGPLYVTLAYERHKDFQSLNTLVGAPASSGRDDAWKAGVSYKFANAFTLGGIFERLQYRADNINGLGALERKVNNWYVVGRYETGAHSLALSYGQKGQEKLSGAGFSDLPDSKAHQISARYGYSFSKRTQLYAMATRITNGSNAFQEFGYAPLTSTTLFRDPSRGADLTGYGIGMIHTF